MGGKDVLLLRDILFQDVILYGTAQLGLGYSLILGIGYVHRPSHGRRRIDGHRRGDLVQRYILEQD